MRSVAVWQAHRAIDLIQINPEKVATAIARRPFSQALVNAKGIRSLHR
jgi:hypothetical protein